MATAGHALWWVGMTVELIAAIWFVVEAFRQGKVWGLCSLLVFLVVVGSAVTGTDRRIGVGLFSIGLVVVLVFLFKHWKNVSMPVMIFLLGGIVSLMGLLLSLESGTFP
jgi:hypothetical protein